MRFSETEDETVRKNEDRQYEIKYKADYNTFNKRVETLESKKIKAYALLWERCAKAMKNKIKDRKDYAKIKNDPILLLKAIMEHALNYQENRYAKSIILDAIRILLGTKQKDGESLQDYTKRFRVAHNVLKSHIGGPIILKKIVEVMSGYDQNDAEGCNKLQEKAFNQFLAYLYMDNADKTKYRSILTVLNTQQSLGNNQYPKTITEANNVLSNHRFDTSPKAKDNKAKQHSDNGKAKNNKDKEKDDDDDKVNLLFAQMEGKCYCCGKAGHKPPSCRDKDKPKDQSAINKAQQSHVQSASDTSTVKHSESKRIDTVIVRRR